MGGAGSRFGATIPKQFTLVDNRPLFTYIAQKLSKLNIVHGIIIVVNPQWVDYTKEWVERINLSKILKIVHGGKSRSESVLNGLYALQEIAYNNDIVLMHDATHPYVDEEGTFQVIKMVEKYGSATLASLNYDTTYMMDTDNIITEVIPRKQVIAGASPEGFLYKEIFDIYKNTPENELEKMTSVGAIALANNMQMKVVPTKILNLKITYPEDMELFLKLKKNYFFDYE